MADLLSLRTLAVWTQNDPAEVAEDEFAVEVVDKVSQLAQFLGGHDEWTIDGPTKAPFDVQMVVLQVCKRTYSNPDQEVSSNTGPIGSRVLDVAALLTDLTESERKTLTKYNPTGDPDAGAGGGLWVLHTTVGPEAELNKATRLFVDDNQQIGMTPEESAYPSWSVPMFSPGDPGDPNLYED